MTTHSLLGETNPDNAETLHDVLVELNGLPSDDVKYDQEPAARERLATLADALSAAAAQLTQEQILVLIQKIDDRDLQGWIDEELGRNRREKAQTVQRKRMVRTKPVYDMSNLALSVMTVNDEANDLSFHKQPVTSIDEAKRILDDLKTNRKNRYYGQILTTVQPNDGETYVWLDPVFELSDLDTYFAEIGTAGGYVSHAAFSKDIACPEFQIRKGVDLK